MVKSKIRIFAIISVIIIFISGLVTANQINNNISSSITETENNESGPFKYQKSTSYDFGYYIQEGIASDDSGHFFISTARVTLDKCRISVAEINEDTNKFVSSSINGISEIFIDWHIGDPFCDDEFLFVPWIEWNGISDPTKVKCYVYYLSNLTELKASPFDLRINGNYIPGASSGAFYDGYYYFSTYFPDNFNSLIYKFSFNKKSGFKFQYWHLYLDQNEVQGIEFFNDKLYFIRAHGSDNNVYWIDTNTWDKINIGKQNLKKFSGNGNGPYEGMTFDTSNTENPIAYFGFGDYTFESFENTDQFSEANLECDGAINFRKAKPGSSLKSEIKIRNKGNKFSLLNWEVLEIPDWTIWFIDPSSSEDEGQNPISYNGEITIEVTVIVPKSQNKFFNGEIILVNRENEADYCKVNVEITTSRSKNYENTLLIKYLERFPLLVKILSFKSW